MIAVNPTPFSSPLNLANPATESIEGQNRAAERIPESGATFEIPNKKGAETGRLTTDSDRIERNIVLRDTILGNTSTSQSTETNDGSVTAASNEQETAAGQSPETREEQIQTSQDQALIRDLAATDRRVRAHEQAHASVGGALAGSPSFTFRTGPNGVRYAVAGEVSINTSGVSGDPRATLQRANQVARAALAPADPSSTDRRVAASAQALATKARFEIAQLAAAESRGNRGESTTSINGEEIEPSETLRSATSFAGVQLRAALATDATEQVGGQVSASA